MNEKDTEGNEDPSSISADANMSQMSQSETSYLEELPNEIITEILKHLPIRDLMQCYQTSNKLRANIKENILFNYNIDTVKKLIKNEAEDLYRLALVSPEIATVFFDNPEELVNLYSKIMLNLVGTNSKKDLSNLIPNLVNAHAEVLLNVPLRDKLISHLSLYQLLTIIENDTSGVFKDNPDVLEKTWEKQVNASVPQSMLLRIGYDPTLSRFCSDEQREDALHALVKGREDLVVHDTEEKVRNAILQSTNLFELKSAIVQSNCLLSGSFGKLQDYYDLFKITQSGYNVESNVRVKDLLSKLGNEVIAKYDSLSIQATNEFEEDLKNAKSLPELIRIVKTAPIVLTNKKGDVQDIDSLVKTIQGSIVRDDMNITSMYGLRGYCSSLRDTAEKDFEAAIKESKTMDDVVKAINRCPIALKSSRGLIDKKDLVRLISPLNKENANFEFSQITSNYNLREQCQTICRVPNSKKVGAPLTAGFRTPQQGKAMREPEPSEAKPGEAKPGSSPR